MTKIYTIAEPVKQASLKAWFFASKSCYLPRDIGIVYLVVSLRYVFGFLGLKENEACYSLNVSYIRSKFAST